jgi:signal transduction histidine kinase
VKIVALVVGLTLVLLGGLGLFLGGSWSRWSRDTLDAGLEERAVAIAARVEVKRGGRLEMEGEAAGPLRDPSHPFRVVGPGGQLTGGGALPWPEPAPGEAVTVQGAAGGAWRVVTRSLPAGEREEDRGERGDHRGEPPGRADVVVQVAGQEAPFAALGERFRHGLVLALVGALLLGGVAAALLAHLSLRPLARLAGEVESIGATMLDRRVGEHGLDPELRHVARAFNQLLGRLEEAMQRQRQLVSRASHSMRTPTATILTCAEVALRRERSPAEYRAALSDIAAAARESSALVAHLLALARLDDQRGTAALAPVRLDALAAEAAQLVAPRAAEAGLTVEVDVPAGFTVRGDRVGLREFLEALLDNALRYTPRGGRVGIRAEMTGTGGATLSVWDTGPGIPEPERRQVFDRFFRGSAAMASDLPGSGLGLAIVKAIADAHGAPVTLGERPGGGAVISMVLPACETGWGGREAPDILPRVYSDPE